jgi:hypothetical protein
MQYSEGKVALQVLNNLADSRVLFGQKNQIKKITWKTK